MSSETHCACPCTSSEVSANTQSSWQQLQARATPRGHCRSQRLGLLYLSDRLCPVTHKSPQMQVVGQDASAFKLLVHSADKKQAS
eukprot:6464043-Amphidinium_carterae.1